ncbi:glutaminyl-peptide cyclotransferase [Corynebacterium sp. TAE3-ERU16]|uniref:glutaminyl-peptide cyclotransferase n=1 Tax=Corynebacterium sp. TAE3-ERU16 TaxID=2849493 RepID=UPI001C443B49|nr:glutaminyl-peptide cyclotransferase [Corynebacterium sp. TAE3-ERU16]MBV7293041.1 glutaminyl-peptide cyclotransferase [Corynebacterium sp. TAE3-ERU16]
MPPVTPRRTRRALTAALLTALLTGCGGGPEPSADDDREVARFGVEIVDRHPMDPTSFTQGLEYDGERLLVGTGLTGVSRVYTSGLDGREIRSAALPGEFFGEGVTDTGTVIWQLTWKGRTAIRRDRETLRETGRASYPGEGWGLCSFSDTVVMSDGSDHLRLLDPDDLRERSRVPVTIGGEPLEQLNELECIEDHGHRSVLANVWKSTDIVRIDPVTGTVDAVIDASDLDAPAPRDPDDVLNGIARIPGTDRLLLTGKRWGTLYEVRLTERPPTDG